MCRLFFQNVVSQCPGVTTRRCTCIILNFYKVQKGCFFQGQVELNRPWGSLPRIPGAHLRPDNSSQQSPRWWQHLPTFLYHKRAKLILPLDKPAQLPQFPSGASVETQVDLLCGPPPETATPSASNGPHGNGGCFLIHSASRDWFCYTLLPAPSQVLCHWQISSWEGAWLRHQRDQSRSAHSQLCDLGKVNWSL